MDVSINMHILFHFLPSCWIFKIYIYDTDQLFLLICIYVSSNYKYFYNEHFKYSYRNQLEELLDSEFTIWSQVWNPSKQNDKP